MQEARSSPCDGQLGAQQHGQPSRQLIFLSCRSLRGSALPVGQIDT
ncbi:hypothetical protein ACFPRL_34190 [Pseudoclavibacter helvolus]